MAGVGRYASTLLIAAATLTGLLPFVGKAFHMDDPLFIWTARHLQSNPLNFYGFNVNWEGTVEPIWSVTQNPPLASYYMAVVAWIGGWSEVVLHTGFLVPAMAVALGTHRLARHFCRHPLWAALGLVITPVFIVSSSSVMSDTPMLTFWVWSLALWVEGIRHASRSRLLAAAVLAAVASLTKYFGASLLPLMIVYAWLERRPARQWLPILMLPLAILAAYQFLTERLYREGLLLNAVAYATHMQVGGELPFKVLATLAFTGAGAGFLLFAAPWLWSRKQLSAGVVAVLLVGTVVIAMKEIDSLAVSDINGIRWEFVIQVSAWAVAGASALALALTDWRRHRKPESLLLLLWVTGTMAFAGLVNWTVSGRNVLPLLPAVSILAVRRLEARATIVGRFPRAMWVPAALSFALAMLVARADYQLAGSAKIAASEIANAARANSGTLRFEGHWGFQYYMEKAGAKPLDRDRLALSPRDTIAVPLENSYAFPLPGQIVEPWFTDEVAGPSWLSTMDGTLGAGYYSDGWGPLPFVFAAVPPERYALYRVR